MSQKNFAFLILILLFVLFSIFLQENKNFLLFDTSGDKSDLVAEKPKINRDIDENLKWPEFIIFGVSKCGTGALKKFLKYHDELSTSGELYFFHNHYHKGYDWYQSQMPKIKKNQKIFEKTPNYYLQTDVPERIRYFNESIKLIMVVCDPVKVTIIS